MKPSLTPEQLVTVLPEMCMSRLPSDGSPILIKRGQIGYRDYNHDPDEFNRIVGVSPAQREAMVAGSMFGFDVPGANPENYDENGKPLTARKHRHGNLQRYRTNEEMAEQYGTDPRDEAAAEQDACERTHD